MPWRQILDVKEPLIGNSPPEFEQKWIQVILKGLFSEVKLILRCKK